MSNNVYTVKQISEEESREQIEEIIHDEEPVKEAVIEPIIEEEEVNQNRNLKPAESEPNQNYNNKRAS